MKTFPYFISFILFTLPTNIFYFFLKRRVKYFENSLPILSFSFSISHIYNPPPPLSRRSRAEYRPLYNTLEYEGVISALSLNILTLYIQYLGIWRGLSALSLNILSRLTRASSTAEEDWDLALSISRTSLFTISTILLHTWKTILKGLCTNESKWF